MQLNVKENANFSLFNICIQLNQVPVHFLWQLFDLWCVWQSIYIPVFSPAIISRVWDPALAPGLYSVVIVPLVGRTPSYNWGTLDGEQSHPYGWYSFFYAGQRFFFFHL